MIMKNLRSFYRKAKGKPKGEPKGSPIEIIVKSKNIVPTR